MRRWPGSAPTRSSQAAVSLGIAVAVGFVGNDLKRWTLSRRGYVESDIVTGDGADAAERRFFDRHPELAAELAR